MDMKEFQETVWEYARNNGRHSLPWRTDPSPYRVLVSEIMLQQTQVDRVIPKFTAFMEQFPTVEELAGAPLSEVLVAWQGLGYNRRAKYLQQAAQVIARLGVFPQTKDELVRLPGVGPNTAGAICAYAYRQPVVYIETNIRTVYLHHFFPNALEVRDAELLPLIERSVDREHPREWYGALMDYGTYLKKQGYARNNASKHYKKQSVFKGSTREMRGRIMRELAKGPMTATELQKAVRADTRYDVALQQLLNEGLVKQDATSVSLF
jgi:A/G-specific adenine glycosylase